MLHSENTSTSGRMIEALKDLLFVWRSTVFDTVKCDSLETVEKRYTVLES